jgi:hypothetical protein
MAVGAGGAFTDGVNRLPPVGLIDFSVGATVGDDGATLVVVVVVVVVVVSGAFFSSFAHDAVKLTIATIAPPPMTAATRRAIRADFFMQSSHIPDQCQLHSKTSLATGTLIEHLEGRTVFPHGRKHEG